jgi:AcrR family transcriptional regulator
MVNALVMWHAGRMEAKGIVKNARERVRAAVSADIAAEARRQLADVGAGALSLRAVARELGMASSAMYRYFPSRDDLLTALIVEAYDALGEVAEAAASIRGTAFARWQTVCRAIRQWALEHPHEYVLLYGSPVPGYHAPEITLIPASRVTLALAKLIADAHRGGELEPTDGPPLPRAVAAQVKPIAELAMPGVPLATVAQALLVWAQLFGQISFELFDRFEGIIEKPETLFEHAVTTMAAQLGLRSTRTARS